MTRPRVFHPGPLVLGRSCPLGRETGHYLRQVLRLKKNDEILVASGSGEEFLCQIEAYKDHNVWVVVKERITIPGYGPDIVLAQGLAKGETMDHLLEKATELGVRRIIPFRCQRCVPRLHGDRAEVKLARWRKLVQESARKVGRAFIPQVEPLVDYAEMFDLLPGDACRLLFWEEEDKRGIKDLCRNNRDRDINSFVLAIGPEGGFTRGEVELARARGFVTVGLGRQILKVDSAVVTVLAIIQYEWGSLGSF